MEISTRPQKSFSCNITWNISVLNYILNEFNLAIECLLLCLVVWCKFLEGNGIVYSSNQFFVSAWRCQISVWRQKTRFFHLSLWWDRQGNKSINLRQYDEHNSRAKRKVVWKLDGAEEEIVLGWQSMARSTVSKHLLCWIHCIFSWGDILKYFEVNTVFLNICIQMILVPAQGRCNSIC